jgi:hypothetical protein
MAALTGVMTADFTGFIQEVDKSVVKLKQLESASDQTSEGMQEFSDGINQVDSSLSAVGINVGKPLRALQELNALRGKEIGDMGLVALTGSLGAAAVAGWELGKVFIEIGNIVGVDIVKNFGDATAALLGWGDLAAETAAAKLMNLSRASEIAGRSITNAGEALRIITKHNADTNESFNTGAHRVKEWQAEIDRVRSKLPEIDAELKNHNSTNKEIAQHYGISTRALEYYNRTLTDSAKAQKAWADEAKPRYEALARAQEEINNAGLGWQKTIAAIDPTIAAHATKLLALDVSMGSIATKYGLTAAQVQALDKSMQYNTATMAVTEPALGSLDAWIKQNYADTKAWNSEWRFTSEVIGEKVNPAIKELTANIEQVSTAMAATESFLGPKGGGGAIDTSGMTIPNMDELWRQYNATHMGSQVGGGEDVISYGLRAGLIQRPGGGFNAPSISNVFNIVDTESEIARRVSDTISSQLQRGSLVN